MPRIIETNQRQTHADAIDAAVHVLRSGGLVLFPADTTYVVCSLTRLGGAVSGGVERLFSLKRRGRGPSFPWLISSPAELEVYGMEITDCARVLADTCWPGGLSIVVKASAAIPRILAREDGTVALRNSASPFAAAFLRACGAPLVMTGASVHGAPNPLSFDEVDSKILDQVDIALSVEDADCQGTATIVDCTQAAPRILCEGLVSSEHIESVLGYALQAV